MPASPGYSVQDLLRVMQRLRDPQLGCPWDLEQDFASIVPSTLEEAYELVEAIEQQDYPHLAEELGDLMFQVVFYAQLGQERELFDFEQVVSGLVDKLVRRHPHVFADGQIEGVVESKTSIAGVKQSWEAIKQQERHARSQASVLDDIPLTLPALSRAQKVQKRVANVGFDWPDSSGVLAKIAEELQEFKEAAGETRERQEEELGDLIFSCVNLARHTGVDAEAALRRATRKFEQRFTQVEQRVVNNGGELQDTPLAELDQIWDAVKQDA
ncbi:MAG: nucleoside triphosphate pyrophosphohydrolase [Halieaceae bacterium]